MLGKDWKAWARKLPVQALKSYCDALASLHPLIKEQFEGLETVHGILQLEMRRRFKKQEDEDYE